MLTYDLAQRGELSRYEYLYRCIRRDIEAGTLEAGDRLPSKRRLAEHLSTSLVTVENAYAQLAAEGYVETRQRRGYYVRRIERPASSSLAVSASPSVGEEPREEGHSGLLADFSQSSAAVDESAASLWERALREVIAHEPTEELFATQPAQGTLRLRAAIASYLEGSRGVRVSPSCIVVGAGAQVLDAQIVKLLGRERIYALEDPGYTRLARLYLAEGVRLAYVGSDAEGVSLDDLRGSEASVVHLMPSHQFPTGRVTSIARRYGLLGWASEQPGRYIVEDDYDRDFRLAGRPIPPLKGIDASGCVIYTDTFTKSLSPSLRLAFMVLPPALVEPYRQRLECFSNTVSVIDQVALSHVLESGAYERHVNRYRRRQREIRDALVEAIEEGAFGPLATIEEADSGLHFVLALETALAEDEVARRSLAEGVRLVPLSSFVQEAVHATSPDGRARFVMQYGGLDLGRVSEVVRVLERCLR